MVAQAEMVKMPTLKPPSLFRSVRQPVEKGQIYEYAEALAQWRKAQLTLRSLY
jgi:hypothetical protein